MVTMHGGLGHQHVTACSRLVWLCADVPQEPLGGEGVLPTKCLTVVAAFLRMQDLSSVVSSARRAPPPD